MALAGLLAACASPSVGGQAAPANQGPYDRINMYEVPTDPSTDVSRPEQQEASGPGWIQVSGNGSVSVAPDRAMVSFAMETRAASAGEAAQANADAMTSVLDAVRAADLEGLVLRTFGYALVPEYSVANNQQTREIVAYSAHNNVRATTEDVEAVGRLIDSAIAAGANRVAQISFFAADTEDARSAALAMAVRDARAEAEVIAESLGYRLGPPLEVNGGGNRGYVPQAEAFSLSRAATTPIEAGDQTVSASVSIRFALGRELGG
jgi:uncharacterized protein